MLTSVGAITIALYIIGQIFVLGYASKLENASTMLMAVIGFSVIVNIWLLWTASIFFMVIQVVDLVARFALSHTGANSENLRFEAIVEFLILSSMFLVMRTWGIA